MLFLYKKSIGVMQGSGLSLISSHAYMDEQSVLIVQLVVTDINGHISTQI